MIEKLTPNNQSLAKKLDSFLIGWTGIGISISLFGSNKLYVETYTLKKKEVEMNVTRTFLHEGKTLQELMEILLPIYLHEKTCNKEEEELEFTQQKILK